ncbi:MAG: lipopolysaccharide biosynthesis protein [Candidatus Krumholzibacteriia bacterium]
MTKHGFAAHFVESVFLTWAGNVARLIIGIVALRLVTSSIAESELGAYWILTSVSALLANFADLGIGLAAVRHLPLRPDRQQTRRLMHTLLLLRAAVLLLLCLVIFAFKPWVLRVFDARAIADNYYYVYIFVIVMSLMELYTNFLQGLNRFRAIAAFAFISSFGRLGLIVLMVRGLGLGIGGLFAAEVASMALAVGLSAAASAHGLRLHFDRGEARLQLVFGFPLYLNTLLAYTANRLNTLIIGSFSGPAAVSHFTVAARMPEQLSMVLRTYNYVYLPNMTRLLAEPEGDRARRLLAASLRVMSFVFAMVTLAFSFFRRELLLFLAPPSYQTAALAVPLLVGSITFASLGSVMGSTIVALGDSRTPVKINFWTTLFSLAMNLILIPRWGFMGAAWATLVFNVVAYAVTDLVLARRLQPENRSYLVILAFLGGCLALGFDAGLWTRLGILAGSGLGSLALSAGLRADLGRVWAARRRRR